MATRKWGSETLVNTTTANNQFAPVVTALEGGGYVVAWTDDRGASSDAVRFQMFDDRGIAVGTEQTVFDGGLLLGGLASPTIVGLASGKFWLVNTDLEGGSNLISGSVFNQNGGFDLTVNPVTVAGGTLRTAPSVATDNIGNMFAAWVDPSLNGGDIRVRGFNPNGTQRFNELTINTNAGSLAASQDQPVIASFGFGGTSRMLVAWHDTGLNGGDIRGRIIDSSGNNLASEFAITGSGGDEKNPSAAWLDGARFVVTWTDDTGDGDSTSIKARLFDRDGVAIGNEFVVNSTGIGDQVKSKVTSLPTGGFVDTWQDNGGGFPEAGTPGIRLQAFDAGGAKVGSEIVVATTTAGNQTEPSVTALEDGRVVVAWTDGSATGGDTSGNAIRMQIVDPRDGTVAGGAGNGGNTDRAVALYGHQTANDSITGSGLNDIAWGLGGNDDLIGGAGRDHLIGGLGDDRIEGGFGNDLLTGGGDKFTWGFRGATQILADVNGDKTADVIEKAADGTLTLFASAGGRILAPRPVDAVSNGGPLLTGDFNGDKRADFLQFNGGTAQIAFAGNANQIVAFNTNSGTGFSATDRVADVNGDGRSDVVQILSDQRAFVAISNGGSFNAFVTAGTGFTLNDKFGDFNGDGKTDIVQLLSDQRALVSLSNGTGFGAFQQFGTGFTVNDRVADVNGDGKSDIVQILSDQRILVSLANAAGTGFLPFQAMDTGATPDDRFGDFNGDGKADLIQILSDQRVFVALAQTVSGTTSYKPYALFGTGAQASDVIADVTGDGKSDLVQLFSNGNAYLWSPNATSTAFLPYTVAGKGQEIGASQGSDTFVFGSQTFGNDIITDFQAGAGNGDVIEISRPGFDEIGDILAITADFGGNAVITFDAGSTITIQGVTKAQLAADDFLFI